MHEYFNIMSEVDLLPDDAVLHNFKFSIIVIRCLKFLIYRLDLNGGGGERVCPGAIVLALYPRVTN